MVIIGADGAFSKIRRSISKDYLVLDEYISIQEWFQCSDPMPYFTAIFDGEISDFYSWIIPKENYAYIRSALRPKDNPIEKYQILKSKMKKIRYRFS